MVKKMRIDRKKMSILEYTADMILIILLSLIYYLIMIVQTNEVVYIPQGSINRIITHLQKKKYDLTKLDSVLLRFIGEPQSGWIYIGQKRLRRADFLYTLTTAKAAMVDVTLIPGETTYVFLNKLAEKLALDRVKLHNEFSRQSPLPEGTLLPETYKLPMGISEYAVIHLLLTRSQKQMRYLARKIFGRYDKRKWLRYLVVASIIQKEAASKEEMPLIASVIYNRLKKGMKLQMDGTLNYGRYSHLKITAKRLRNDTSRYNTYKYKGLPPYPVCNPGMDAIKAAIFPAKTSYLYFVKLRDGRHAFAYTYKQHRKNIKSVTKSIN